jgi:hypothetical protein
MVVAINPARQKRVEPQRQKVDPFDRDMNRVLKALQIANTGFQIYGEVTTSDAEQLKMDADQARLSREQKITEGLPTAEEAQRTRLAETGLKERQAEKLGAETAKIKISTPSREHQNKIFEAQLGEATTKANQQDFKDVQSMRKEWNSSPITKQTRQANIAIEKIRSSGRGEASAAKDHSLVFNYMKTVDPTSTVREGEFATVQQATGLIDRATIQLFNKALNGEMLTPEQRQDFLNVAEDLYDAQVQQQSQYDSEFTRIAEGRGFDPKEIVLQLGVGERPDQTGAAAPQQPKKDSKRLSDDQLNEEFNRLIKGLP